MAAEPGTESGTQPGIRRRRARTSHRQSAFLADFAVHGNVAAACRPVGVDRRQIYRWLEDDPDFAERFREAEQTAVEVLELEAYRRAVIGTPYRRTSYWRGEEVGVDEKTEYSDGLLTTLLKARAPDKYRDRLDLAVAQVIKTVGFDPTEVLGSEVLGVQPGVPALPPAQVEIEIEQDPGRVMN